MPRLFTLGNGGTLAAVLLLCLPFRRRKWQVLLGLFAMVVIGSAAIGCGSTSTTHQSTGTTPGSYTVTVTGTSGSTSAEKKIVVTIN
jgi:hypothetical protein